MTGFNTPAQFEDALRALPSKNEKAAKTARARQDQLTKPPGSLGRLEEIAIFMAGWQGNPRPTIERAHAIVFAGNHGIAAQGVSAFPLEVTAQMVANFKAGGAAINALATAAGMTLDVVALDLDRPTADFTKVPAMSEVECIDAINAGTGAIGEADLLVLGEMGIGNSTTAAALAIASFGGNASDWVGPGTGVDNEGVARKCTVVEAGMALHHDALTSPFEILRRLGGREIAAIAGGLVAARHKRIPIILDGFIATSAVAPLAQAFPDITAHCLAGHCSAEPGHRRLLDHLGLTPLLSLDMRLGEGSGAAVAVQIVRSALAAHNQMATFAEAGVTDA